MRSLRCCCLLLLASAASAASAAATGAPAPEGAAAGGAMRVADEWFPQAGDNLTRVDWAHAVNDRAYLDAALASDVMMIEADIVLGWLEDAPSAAAAPVMAHPPATVSDLSLAAFLSAVAEHNERASPDARKGVKLDFKSIEAFEAAEQLVAPLAGDQMKFPVWLNADILPGPVHSDATPVDAARFLRVARGLPRAMLSVGWTTRYGGTTGVTSGAYEPAHAASMRAALRAHRVAQPITFPVRAGLAAAEASAPVLRSLLADTSALVGAAGAVTLTVWSSEGDPVDAVALRALILAVGLDRVYLDVPADLAARLRLPAADLH